MMYTRNLRLYLHSKIANAKLRLLLICVQMQVKCAYVMCSLKPLAICTHRNFNNIQKRPINSSRGKSFSKTIKFIRDHFQTRNINCSGTPGGRISRQLLVHSLLSVKIFCLWLTSTRFTFSFQNHRMSRKFVVCSLEVGIEAIAIRIISLRCPCGLLVSNLSCLWRLSAHQAAALLYYQGGGGHKAGFHFIKQSWNKSWNEVQPLLLYKAKKIVNFTVTTTTTWSGLKPFKLGGTATEVTHQLKETTPKEILRLNLHIFYISFPDC